MQQATAVLVGGPTDQTLIELPDETVVHEIRVDGTVHRYIRTTAHRSVEGRDLIVYNYDGQTYDGAVHPPERD
jgi:hypothetical protein